MKYHTLHKNRKGVLLPFFISLKIPKDLKCNKDNFCKTINRPNLQRKLDANVLNISKQSLMHENFGLFVINKIEFAVN